ncbi:MAG TPA: hypothetical protein VMP01_04205, partial [Pirellulaceae bacterium]|nr:hypothetical protein [Pirellulaceae bacterium]
MSRNPYHPSSISPNDLDARGDRPRRRPIGISIPSVLHLAGGLAFGALWMWISNFDDNEQWLAEIGLSVPAFMAIGAVFTVLAVASGIGMWLGAKWAWWLASFYYFSMLLGNLCEMLLILPLKARLLDLDEIGLEAARLGMRTVILFLFVTYLFRSKVLEYFGLASMRKLKAIGILFGITLLFLV